MIEPTKTLSLEHERILAVLGALERECNALEKGKDVDMVFFRNAIDFIRNYADGIHHAKEEKILFVELNACEGMHCNPVQQMLFEHERGREFVAGMLHAIERNDEAALVENSRGYVRLLREHIFKEDHILFPMAAGALSQQEKESVATGFEKADGRVKQQKQDYEVFSRVLEARE